MYVVLHVWRVQCQVTVYVCVYIVYGVDLCRRKVKSSSSGEGGEGVLDVRGKSLRVRDERGASRLSEDLEIHLPWCDV